ncbi:hypothetical protein RvY_05395 [Ramazzottius varieornatus]|uniref:Uncharacterized protein n=1 Tax=Ramazzottius varieornatus TaxID=947166 RepID=A0A1D1V4P5_RAMVA|nr:hypothetical protein RvY_05395 [Ramazzottius varieornatus]
MGLVQTHIFKAVDVVRAPSIESTYHSLPDNTITQSDSLAVDFVSKVFTYSTGRTKPTNTLQEHATIKKTLATLETLSSLPQKYTFRAGGYTFCPVTGQFLRRGLKSTAQQPPSAHQASKHEAPLTVRRPMRITCTRPTTCIGSNLTGQSNS